MPHEIAATLSSIGQLSEDRVNALRGSIDADTNFVDLEMDSLTALDFCVTYEVSPPGWEKPRCHVMSILAERTDDSGQSVLGVILTVPLAAALSAWLPEGAARVMNWSVTNRNRVQMYLCRKLNTKNLAK